MLRGALNGLAARLILGSVLVIAVASGTALRLVEDDLSRRWETRYVEQVTRARSQEEQRILADANLRLAIAGELAAQPQLQAALAGGSAAALLGPVASVAQAAPVNAGASGIHVYDARGLLIARSERPAIAPSTPVAEVVRVLTSRQAEGFLRQDESLGLGVSGIAPVVSGGLVLGAVEVVSALDNAFARADVVRAGLSITVVAQGRVAGASDAEAAIDPAALTDQLRTDAGMAPVYLETRGGPALASRATLTAYDGRPLGDLYVSVARTRIAASVGAARDAVLRAVGIGALLALVTAAALAWYTALPVRELVRAGQRIQDNDLESPVQVVGPAELGELGAAMDEMRRAMRMARESLLTADRDLALRVTASTQRLSEVTEDIDVWQGIVRQLSGEAGGGMAGVAEELARLGWVDGTFIALADATGGLATMAATGLPPGATDAILEVARTGVAGRALGEEIAVPSTAREPAAQRLTAWLIGGFALQPLVTPDGIAGVIGVTSTVEMEMPPLRRELLRSIAHEVAGTIERSELAGEVEENRRIAEAVLREMADGVLVIDHDDVCRICNPAAARLLGIARAEIVGQPASRWLPVSASAIETLRERSRERLGASAVPLHAEVEGRQLAISSGPFPDPDPQRTGMIILVRDLSAEAEADRVKRDFVSMVGHELRTPLTLIRTTIDLLHEADAGALNPTQTRIVEVLQSNSERLMSLINDLLDMSALDSGRLQITPASVDLGEIVDTAVEHQRSAAEARQHAIQIEDAPGVLVWADPGRVGQVLSNLLSNAIKYTPPGGRITVRVQDTRPFATVSVIDSGIGIPPAEQAPLFEKFYRTSAGRRTTGGTGLGLAIARSIIDLHGGTIGCDSDGEHGTTFTFTLPRRPL